MATDLILNAMAVELRGALGRKGLDHRSPPQGNLPTEMAWREYQRRGGSVYSDPDQFVKALVEQVKNGD